VAKKTIISSKTPRPKEAPPAKHRFKVLIFTRVLTKHQPRGKPSLKQVRMTRTEDLIKLDPQELVTLVDETGAQVDQMVRYGKKCQTGAQLVANTSPGRVLAITEAKNPKAKHEPGLPMRLGLEMQALNSLLTCISDGVAVPTNVVAACSSDESRLIAWCDHLEKLQSRLGD
jgi:hypothetical protein